MIETNLQEKRNPTQIVWRVVFPGEEYMMSNTKKTSKNRILIIQISQQKN